MPETLTPFQITVKGIIGKENLNGGARGRKDDEQRDGWHIHNKTQRIVYIIWYL